MRHLTTAEMREPADPRYCKHSYSVQKRWEENGVWYAILRCRRYGCNIWTRKKIVLKQNSHKPEMKTENIIETIDIDTNTGSAL